MGIGHFLITNSDDHT